MLLEEIVGTICLALAPINLKLSLANLIADHIKFISIAFDRFCLTVSVAIPLAVLLSVAIGVAGWGCPYSSRAMRRGHASLPALWNKAPNLASAALERTPRMM